MKAHPPSRPRRAKPFPSAPPASRPGNHALAGALAVLSTGLCGGDGGPAGRPGRPADVPERTNLRRPNWEAAFRIGGGREDTLLLDPHDIAADDHGVSVVDLVGGRVLRFAAEDGRLEWSFGGTGHGPDEFSRPMDLEVDGEGRTWILDTRNRRITILRRDGSVHERLPLERTGTVPDAFVPLPDLGALLLSSGRGTSMVELSPRGREVHEIRFPADDIVEMDPISAQLSTVNVPGSGQWVAAMVLGNRFFVLDGTRKVAPTGWYAEPVPAPDVDVRYSQDGENSRRVTRLMDRDPVIGQQSLGVADGRLYVLFAGRSEYAGRVVDVYSLPEGAYLESLLLPGPVEEIAAASDRIYVLHNSPYPTLLALDLPEP